MKSYLTEKVLIPRWHLWLFWSLVFAGGVRFWRQVAEAIF